MINLLADIQHFEWIFAFCAFVVGIVFVVAILATQIRKYASHRHELELKRDLVERGLSIDEIERVIAARSEPDIR
jgi:hypothetical protein